MGTFESQEHTFEHWRSLLEAYLHEPYRWDLPEQAVLYTDDNKDLYVCRNNTLQHIISIMELALVAPHAAISDTDVAEVKACMKRIVQIAKERGIDKKTDQDMQEIRAAVERCVEIFNAYRQ